MKLKELFEKKAEQEMSIVCDWNEHSFVERNFLIVMQNFKHAKDKGWRRESISGLVERCKITFTIYCKPSQLWKIKETCYDYFCKGCFPIF